MGEPCRSMESTGGPITEGRPVEHAEDVYTDLLRSAATLLTGHRRRLFEAEVCQRLCDGNVRVAERRFGWGRDTVAKGTHERQAGVRCLENFRARGRRRTEDADRKLAEDIRSIVEPKSYTDPELKSSRRYCTMSAGEVLEALGDKGYKEADLPAERTMRPVRQAQGRAEPDELPPQAGPEGQAVAEDGGDRRDLRQRGGRAGRGPRRPRRHAGDLDGHQGKCWRRRLRPGGKNVEPVRTAASPRAGTTTRRPSRSSSRWAS